MAEEVEKVYCCERPTDNSALWAALMNRDSNPSELMALMNNNQWTNNPFFYLIFMMMFRNGGMWGDGTAANSDRFNELSSRMADNQNTNLMMDAINGNHEALHSLSSALGVDFATMQGAISGVQNAVTQVGGAVGMTGERVVNSILLGNKDLTAAVTSCCCDVKEGILKGNYDNQIATLNQTNTLQSRIDQLANGVTQGFSATAYETQRQTSDIINAISNDGQATRALLSNHWQAETSQALQDAKFEISQLKQNQLIVQSLKNNCNCN